MIYTDTTELINYTTAGELAAAFERNVARIGELILELGERSHDLATVFHDPYHFSSRIHFMSQNYDANPDGVAAITDVMKRCAWGAIVQKLELRKIMSAARQKEMDEHLGLGSRSSGHGRQPIPDVTEENIVSIVQGFANSAADYLAEAVAEEFDWWKYNRCGEYKTNSEFKLQSRLIRPWCVEAGYRGRFDTRYDAQGHLRTLDSLFHRFDGAGVLGGQDSPLLDAIRTAGPDGRGTTAYFRFRCCKNGNLHLEFRRHDLLDQFNQLAGRGRLSCPTASRPHAPREDIRPVPSPLALEGRGLG